MFGDAYYELPSGRVAALDEHDLTFPNAEMALSEPNGLVAIGGDLRPERILCAYSQGIFPWFSEGDPILWWSPNPRMVLFPEALKVSRSLAKTLKHATFEIRYNTAFRLVIEACASTPRAGQRGTWITQEMMESYCRLHDMGYAHSTETWQNNTLVGGLYGIRIGQAFFGESMFHHKTDASKIAFVHTVRTLQQEGVKLIDCQMETAHLASLGATPLARLGFLQLLKKCVNSEV